MPSLSDARMESSGHSPSSELLDKARFFCQRGRNIFLLDNFCMPLVAAPKRNDSLDTHEENEGLFSFGRLLGQLT